MMHSSRRQHGGWKAPLVAAALAVCMGWPGVAAAQPATPQVTMTVTAYEIEGENPIGPEEAQKVLAPYLGAQTGIEGLEAAAQALEDAIRDRGYAFRRVIIPAQKPEGGVVKLRVLRFTVAEVRVSGNRHFTEGNILRSLPGLQAGETPDMPALSRSLAIANQHPVKRVTLVMKESGQADALDAEVTVADADPQQVFLGLSNTGTTETGRWRASIGYQYGNLFDLDHVLTLSYITSPGHAGDVKQYGAFYWVPFYGIGASLSAYYTHSSVDSGTIAQTFEVSGRGDFLGVQYTQALPRLGRMNPTLTLGVDDRLFENDATFGGIALFPDVRSRPLTLGLGGRWLEAWGEATVTLHYAVNLHGGAANDDASYAANRINADPDWDAFRLAAGLTGALGSGWQLNGRLSGQYAGEPLIPGEQFGIGGAYSVRGFKEREIAGDNAWQGSVELYTPALWQNLRLLAFLDAGGIDLEQLPPGQPSRRDISSAGVGVRWSWKQSLSASADLGHVLKGIPDGTSAGDTRLHVSLLYRF